jgi:rhodanese-related sulfurtransferase
MKNLILYILISFSTSAFSQKTLNKLLKQQNKESIPYISVDALAIEQNKSILLDSREQIEYNTSHLKNAIHVGYDFFNIDSIQYKIPNKNSKIVVYCSLGIRSEDIAEKLKASGYTNVFNLYGGIFEWKNNNLDVYNSEEKETDSIHAFNKAWSKWLKKGIKIYD